MALEPQRFRVGSGGCTPALIHLSPQALMIFHSMLIEHVCVVVAVFYKGSLVLSCVRSYFSDHEQAKMGWSFSSLDAPTMRPRLEYLTV